MIVPTIAVSMTGPPGAALKNMISGLTLQVASAHRFCPRIVNVTGCPGVAVVGEIASTFGPYEFPPTLTTFPPGILGVVPPAVVATTIRGPGFARPVMATVASTVVPSPEATMLLTVKAVSACWDPNSKNSI